MATMYYLFLGFLFIAVCSFKSYRNSVLSSRCPVMSTVMETSKDFIETDFSNSLFSLRPQLSFSMTRTYFFSAKKYAKNSSLKTFDTEFVHPSTIVKIFVGDKLGECMAFASTSLQTNLMSPVKLLTIVEGGTTVRSKGSSDKGYGYHNLILNGIHELTGFGWTLGRYQVSRPSGMEDSLISPVKYFAVKNDLLAYGVKGRKATNCNSVHFALGEDSQSKGGARALETLGTACVALRSRDEHRVNSLDLCGTFYQGKVPRLSANEDKRNLLINIASAELGVREATGNNDGPRVEEYLRYTNLGKGYEWCASFVSWCYGQAGFEVPRNPWSPALFPKARQIAKGKARPADVFGIYGAKAKRINHVGLVKEVANDYLITIEGNSNNRVESRRRHLRTVYAVAEWVK